MRRLKLFHLFHGSALPWYLAFGVLIAALAVSSALELPAAAGIILALALPLAALTAAFLLDQRLTPKEQEIVSHTDAAEWKQLRYLLTADLR